MLPSIDFIYPSMRRNFSSNTESYTSPLLSPVLSPNPLISQCCSTPIINSKHIYSTNSTDSLSKDLLKLQNAKQREKFQKTHIFA